MKRLALLLPVFLVGCTWLQSHGGELADLFAEKVQCVLQHQDLPDQEIFARCAVQPGDIDRILPLLRSARTQTAKRAAEAREDERTKLQAGYCAGGGAR